MADSDKSLVFLTMMIIAIIAIVAIVGLVILFTQSRQDHVGNRGLMASDYAGIHPMAGQAYGGSDLIYDPDSRSGGVYVPISGKAYIALPQEVVSSAETPTATE